MNEQRMQKITIWTPAARPSTNPDLQEAARQRDEIRQQMALKEQQRTEKEQLANLLKKYGKV